MNNVKLLIRLLVCLVKLLLLRTSIWLDLTYWILLRDSVILTHLKYWLI